MGLAKVTDYELFRNLCYEDDQRWCYINVGQGIGVAPEELRLMNLGAEQRAFFETHMPDVLVRFRQD